MSGRRKSPGGKPGTRKAKPKLEAIPGGGGGNGGLAPPAPRQAGQERQVVMVPFRGQMQPIIVGGVAMPLILALAALDDPRVNAVLEAYDVVVTNARGETIWPAK